MAVIVLKTEDAVGEDVKRLEPSHAADQWNRAESGNRPIGMQPTDADKGPKAISWAKDRFLKYIVLEKMDNQRRTHTHTHKKNFNPYLTLYAKH